MKQTLIRTVTLALIAIASVGSSSAQAKNYVNWGKGYYVTIPENWRQIERFNVDNFLRLHGNDPAANPYDAFFCPEDATPFYSKAYVFVHAEQVANAIVLADSIRLVMEAEFDAMVNSMSDSSAVTNLQSQKPVYDSKTRSISMVSNLKSGEQDQTLLLMIKFYNQGMATFYCYTTREMFEQYEETFRGIIRGFGDEDLDKAAEQEPVKIATIENTSGSNSNGGSSSGDSESSSNKTLWIPFAGLAIVLIAVIARKKKKQQQT